MKNDCEKCEGKCCKYVVLEIDTPETRKDFEDVKWFVCHKNVNVFVNEEGEWNLEFLTPCEFLGKNNNCEIYQRRPKICETYNTEECLFHNKGYSQKFTFKKIGDIEKYIKEIFIPQKGTPKDFKKKFLLRAKDLHKVSEEEDED